MTDPHKATEITQDELTTYKTALMADEWPHECCFKSGCSYQLNDEGHIICTYGDDCDWRMV